MGDLPLKWLTDTEKEQESKIESILGQTFRIESTDKYPGWKKVTSGPYSIFYPKIYASLLGLSIIWTIVTILICKLTGANHGIYLTTILTACAIGLVSSLLLRFKSIKDSKRKILVNDSGIQIDNQELIPWSIIALTAILTKPLSRNQIKYLVIVDRLNKSAFGRTDVELRDYFSWNPYGFASTISNAIESFKP